MAKRPRLRSMARIKPALGLSMPGAAALGGAAAPLPNPAPQLPGMSKGGKVKGKKKR